jgi:hypothetical protein
MSNIASILIKIKNGVDYTPGGKMIQFEQSPIVSIHLIEPLNGSVEITTLQGSVIEFPQTAFIAGGVYSIPIKKIIYKNKKDDQKFIGGQLAKKPFNLL